MNITRKATWFGVWCMVALAAAIVQAGEHA
jgi:hypothetical protein